MTRRRLNLSDKVAILHRIAPCAICGKPLGSTEPIEWDHIQALSRGGTDTLGNIRPVHANCHKRKTFGSGATTRGSDIGEAAKTKRMVKAQEKLALAMVASSPFAHPTEKRLARQKLVEDYGARPPQRKLQSRPFDKRYRKPVRGKAVRREERTGQ